MTAETRDDVDIDQTMPDGRWEFNREVTDVFDEMLERSVPQYQTMRRTVFEVGRMFRRPGTAVVDIGCSRGEALAPFVDEVTPAHSYRFVGCEASRPMYEAAKERFADRSDVGIMLHDLRDGFPPIKRTSLVLSVLTLMFVPINHRQRIVQQAYDSLDKGGALLLVEKVLGSGARVDDVMVELYHDAKQQAGYSRDEIMRKALALEGVLVPVTYDWNVELLRRSGFREVDGFWRWMSFCGIVAVK